MKSTADEARRAIFGALLDLALVIASLVAAYVVVFKSFPKNSSGISFSFLAWFTLGVSTSMWAGYRRAIRRERAAGSTEANRQLASPTGKDSME